MERSSISTTPTALAGVAFLFFVLLSAYVVGYFSLSTVIFSVHGGCYRLYETEWQATIFKPAAKIESFVRREEVYISVTP